MSRRRKGIMSEELKIELAKDLGFYETVSREGWEGIRTKDAGNMVKRAIQIAQEKLAQDYQRQHAGLGASPYRQQPQRQPSYQQQVSYGASSYQPGYAAQQGSGDSRNAFRQAPSGAQQPQPVPAYAYSRQTGFTPLYPSYYGNGQGASDNQPPNYLN